MKVAVFGAAGRVGKLLCSALRDSEVFEPLAVVRSGEQASALQESGVNASALDIEKSTVEEITAIIEGCDAVVWTACSGGIAMDRIFTMDLDGTIKAIEATQKAKIQRFVMVSAINVDNRERWWHTALKNNFIAKRTADRILQTSGLQYTILRPGSLHSEAGTGKLCALDSLEQKKSCHYSIEREDVANFIVLALTHPEKTAFKTIPLANGELPMRDFLYVV
ncbi:LAQU0S21e00848g1_1 [Lachancea quebecensis]|uniref:LAQU0S21e00848g1_1 n=1 Tax=Lachancea quebecensis TaxID=1654605 RepID=A0A0P1KXU1_9SACH|nr:LAQU0S21e00848g1_1 [Lachancea quebecensis]